MASVAAERAVSTGLSLGSVSRRCLNLQLVCNKARLGYIVQAACKATEQSVWHIASGSFVN